MQTAISVPAAAVVGAGMRSADIPVGHSCTPLARSATGPRRVSCRADSPILGERLRGRGQGPQRKRRKGSG